MGTKRSNGSSDFDLLILDQGLPLMNGLKVIKNFIKKFGKSKLPPVLLLSAFSEEYFTEKDLKSRGIKYFLRKPASVDELKECFKKLNLM